MLPERLNQNPKKSNQKPGNSQFRGYARWSGIAFQMALVVAFGSFAGWKADQWFNTNDPWYTLAGIITGVIAAMVLVIRMILQNKNQE